MNLLRLARFRSSRSVKIAVLTLTFFLFSSIAFASSLHGDYKGNPIIKVTSGGKELTVTDVPAVKLDDRTMVPVYLLRQLGLDVTWDEATQTVDVSVKKEQPSLTQEQLNKIAESVYIVYGSTDDPAVATQGSGFVIGDTLITAAHVSGYSDYSQVMINGQYQKISSYTFVNKTVDVMGFKVTDAAALPYSEELPQVGDKVWAIGYPHGKLSITEGKVTRIVEFRGLTSVYSSAITDNGSSGSVLVNSDGKVIAVNTGGDDQSGETVSLPVSYALDEMR